jgi:ATPase subunit of ABC transporter with duplicated ATPase domains
LCHLKHADYQRVVWQHVSNSSWGEQHQESRRREHESVRESDKLKKGPEFEEAIKHLIPRESLVEEIKQLITPAEETGHYPLIVGEHGTGKTSLIKLAANDMDKDKPKGIVYVKSSLRILQLTCYLFKYRVNDLGSY